MKYDYEELFKTLIEERMFDRCCDNMGMTWDEFINKILTGWIPPPLSNNEHEIRAYQELFKDDRFSR